MRLTKILLPCLWVVLFGCGKEHTLAPQTPSQKFGSLSSQVDSRVLNLPLDIQYNVITNPNPANLKALVTALVGTGLPPMKIAKILHDWIVSNVLYPVDYINTQIYPTTDPYQVLASGRGECCGYTSLFYTMAKMAGLRVAGVTGAPANLHIWNAVYDNNQWNQVDVTWDAGFVTGNSPQYIYSTTYFYISAAQMATVNEHAPFQSNGSYNYDETLNFSQDSCGLDGVYDEHRP